MKRITFLLITISTIVCNLYAQKTTVAQFRVNSRIPNLPLNRIVNYKDSIAMLSSFGEKLVILDFWNIHCGYCIEQFPKEDSLQRAYKDKLQFVLITVDSKDNVIHFFNHWDSIHHTVFSAPIVCGDSSIIALFRHEGIPHYAWLSPNGRLIAQTDANFINATSLVPAMDAVIAEQKDMHRSGFSAEVLHYPKPSSALLKFINENRFQISYFKD